MAMSVVHLRVNASLNKFRRNAQSCVIFLLTFYFLFFYLWPCSGIPKLSARFGEEIPRRDNPQGEDFWYI